MIPIFVLLAGVLAQSVPAQPTPRTGPLILVEIDPGRGILGDNDLRIVLKNASTQPVVALLSVRVESPSRGSQRSHYRSIAPGATAAWTERYRVLSRSHRLLRAFTGVAESAPTDLLPQTWFGGAYETRLFAIHPGVGAGRTSTSNQALRKYWDLGSSVAPLSDRVRAVADSLVDTPVDAEADLRRLLGWDRQSVADFSPRVVGRGTLEPYSVRVMQILGEAGMPIRFQLLRWGAFDSPRPTVVFLPGNPPDTKESGTIPAMILADHGLQLASMDRRSSARETGPGGFLVNIADPVFDARRLVDCLVTREDITSGVSVFGLSMGAYEGMFLAALHSDVSSSVLACRMLDHDSLFASSAWAPTLWAPEVSEDLGLGDVSSNWDTLMEAAAAVVGGAATAYRTLYPFFDQINRRVVLPLAARTPALILTGALDSQISVRGVLPVDLADRARYASLGVEAAAQLYIMPRVGHGLSPLGLDKAAE